MSIVLSCHVTERESQPLPLLCTVGPGATAPNVRLSGSPRNVVAGRGRRAKRSRVQGFSMQRLDILARLTGFGPTRKTVLWLRVTGSSNNHDSVNSGSHSPLFCRVWGYRRRVPGLGLGAFWQNPISFKPRTCVRPLEENNAGPPRGKRKREALWVFRFRVSAYTLGYVFFSEFSAMLQPVLKVPVAFSPYSEGL